MVASHYTFLGHWHLYATLGLHKETKSHPGHRFLLSQPAYTEPLERVHSSAVKTDGPHPAMSLNESCWSCEEREKKKRSRFRPREAQSKEV